MKNLSTWWAEFKYNYSWSDYVGYIDGWLPRVSLFFPLIGYMILVNDEVSELLEFQKITRNVADEFGLSSSVRLRLIYYGLFFLGVSNFIYQFKQPYIFRFGNNLLEYTKSALENFTYVNFLRIHRVIKDEGHLTQDGQYYDSEWEGFTNSALNRGEGTDNVKRTGSWEEAKAKYGSLLRSMLREHFFRYDISNRTWLTACLILSTLGYLLLAVPSLDLFVKITVSTFYSSP